MIDKMIMELDLTKAGSPMARSRFTAEQIILKLAKRKVEQPRERRSRRCVGSWGSRQDVLSLAQEYGGLKLDQAKRFKEMEKENARLKKLVADLSLDKAI